MNRRRTKGRNGNRKTMRKGASKRMRKSHYRGMRRRYSRNKRGGYKEINLDRLPTSSIPLGGGNTLWHDSENIYKLDYNGRTFTVQNIILQIDESGNYQLLVTTNRGDIINIPVTDSESITQLGTATI
jgi:hypothetical protein